MSQVVTINLDPLKDGVNENVRDMTEGKGAFVVLGTNLKHRFITFDEYLSYMKAFGDNAVFLYLGEYMLSFDQSKIIKYEGEEFFVGSFLIIKCSFETPGALIKMDEETVQKIKEDLSGYFVELMINGERHEALALN